jgi:hypothetical protein
MKVLLLILATTLLAGCTSVQYGDVRYKSLFNRKSLSELDITVKSDGSKTLKLRGYRNDQVEALSILTEAAVRGALKGATP